MLNCYSGIYSVVETQNQQELIQELCSSFLENLEMHVLTHCTLLFLLVDTFFSHPFLDQMSNIKKCKKNELGKKF